MTLFPDSTRRLNRAILHYHAIEAEIKRLYQPEVHPSVVEMNEGWTRGTAKTRIPDMPENSIALELGELFYQLRAALDALIYQSSAYVEGKTIPSNEEKVEFPICIDSGKFKRSVVNKPPFSIGLKDWLLSIQPYIACDASNPNYTLSQALLTLHNCARIDRHRRLHVPGFARFDVELDFYTSAGLNVVSYESVDNNIFEEEAIFLRFSVSKDNPISPMRVKLESKFRLHLAAGDLPIPEGSDMAKELSHIIDAVAFVINVFTDEHMPL